MRKPAIEIAIPDRLLAPAKAGGRQLPGLRILVVDGSEINCEMVRRILEAERASVEVEDNGQDARWGCLTRARRSTPG